MFNKMIAQQTAKKEKLLDNFLKKHEAEYLFPEDVELICDIDYMGDGKPCHFMDIYRPRNYEGKLPVMFNLHGGGFLLGKKEEGHLFCAEMSQRGFLVFSFEYPLAPEALFPQILKDLMTGMGNAKRYFERYNKLKRTYEALLIQRKETTEDINHLESISNSLDIAVNDTDLDMIKRELAESGYIKKGAGKNKNKKSNMPKSTYMHYISSDGFDIYVGRNNFQNDELTFGNRAPGDWWFHSKGIAGSHVVLKGNGNEVPDRAFEEAGALAAYYSKGRESGKVEIDYTEIQKVTKPKNSKPGFVVYYTNYSLVADTDISALTLVND